MTKRNWHKAKLLGRYNWRYYCISVNGKNYIMDYDPYGLRSFLTVFGKNRYSIYKYDHTNTLKTIPRIINYYEAMGNVLAFVFIPLYIASRESSGWNNFYFGMTYSDKITHVILPMLILDLLILWLIYTLSLISDKKVKLELGQKVGYVYSIGDKYAGTKYSVISKYTRYLGVILVVVILLTLVFISKGLIFHLYVGILMIVFFLLHPLLGISFLVRHSSFKLEREEN